MENKSNETIIYWHKDIDLSEGICGFETFVERFEKAVIRGMRRKKFKNRLKEIFLTANQMDTIDLEAKIGII